MSRPQKKKQQKKKVAKSTNNAAVKQVNAEKKEVATSNKRSTRLGQLAATLGARIKRLPTYVWIWLLLLASAASLAAFSTTNAGAFSGNDIYEVSFDHLPSVTEVEKILSNSNLQVSYSDLTVEGNYATFRTAPNPDLRSALESKLKSAPGAITATASYVIAPNPVTDNLPSLAIYFTLFAVLSFITVWILLRNESRSQRLKAWVSLLIIPSMGAILLAGIAVALSQAKLIKFTPATWDLFLGSLAAVTILIGYLVSKEELRKWLIGRLFSN